MTSAVCDVLDQSATGLLQLIKQRDLTCVELAAATFERIDALNPTHNVIVALRDRESVLADARRKDMEPVHGALFGLPTAQIVPFPIETHWPKEILGRQMTTYQEWMKCGVTATMMGGASLSAPASFDARGLPMDIQITGRNRSELDCLRPAAAYHKATLSYLLGEEALVMPHAVIEYSANLEAEMDPERIVQVVHDAMLAQPIFDAAGIRTRAARREHFRIADGDPRNAFIAVTVRIGPGRAPAQRRQASEAIMQALYDAVAPIYATRGLSLSVEVTELDGGAMTRRNSLREGAAAKG